MNIKLAGYNVDADMLGHQDQHEIVTPETISAAYARISRSPKDIGELRVEAAADVTKARASNEQIVFDMGHSSIAEHAVFNFDVMDVSRLAIESIEHARLASYTEKSQRYLQLKGLDEVHVPAEIPKEDRDLFVLLMSAQMDTYQKLYKAINEYLVASQGYQLDRDGPSTAQKKAYDGKAKEDARYVTSLAVTGQLGMTINARNLETMVRRLVGHELVEVQGIGHELHAQALAVAPSLLRYCAPEPIRQLSEMALPGLFMLGGQQEIVTTVLPCAYTKRTDSFDDHVLTALMFQRSQAPYDVCAASIRTMSREDKWRTFCEIYERMELHSAAPRGFEIPDMTFEMVGSASFFAQLKRHRMATILPQDYDTGLGCTVPKSIKDAGLQGQFDVIQEETENTYDHLKRRVGRVVADYALMQAHRRRVLIKMNARQLYAFSRLREDGHAQWEIREAAHVLMEQAREVMPMTLALACGKDEFVALKKRVLTPIYAEEVL